MRYLTFYPDVSDFKEFEDAKGVTRIRISKKNRQHKSQKKKYKRTTRSLAQPRGGRHHSVMSVVLIRGLVAAVGRLNSNRVRIRDLQLGAV
jgi:hypothetical protein